MALETRGFALSSLGQAPEIPANVGKIDVGSIYDRVKQGLQTGELLRTALAQQQATDASLRAETAQAPMRTAILAENAAQAPMQTSLLSDKATLSSATAPRQILASNATLDADLAAEQNKRDSARAYAAATSGLSPAARVQMDAHGAPISTASDVTRTPEGTVVGTTTQTANIGGVEVPVSKHTTSSPSAPVITPITGANGLPGGYVISVVGPDGKITTQHLGPQIGALNRLNEHMGVGTPHTEYNPATGEAIHDIYPTFMQTGNGGIVPGKPITVNHGEASGFDFWPNGRPPQSSVSNSISPPAPVDTAPSAPYQIKASTPDGIREEAIKAKNAGFTRIITPDGQEHVLAPAPTSSSSVAPTVVVPPPLAQPASNSPKPASASVGIKGTIQAGLDAKNRMEALNELASERVSNDTALANVQRVSDAVDALNKHRMLPNQVTGHLGFLRSNQELESATSQFAKDIVEKFRGAGRVTQTEFNYAQASYPLPGQDETVQRNALAYLKNFVGAVNNRINYEYAALKANPGLSPADAKIEASQKFPILPPRGFSPSNGR